ncbi:hypothetical protein VII00023_12426 [Vibrio ichthyoenteri ATCC 700023]|uniref:Uncharacterized protein n=1 Tax=Vibrio ichthyoenteri ATCC 700023 TaxID=870968 RepID=F9S2W6_9VIBR|nr:hypothetical protein VII00023_12426 [Vibrio ichthyoenteri ATCC 700023]
MKCKLKKYYSELRHFERQNPNSKISTQSVIMRLKEIIKHDEAKKEPA